MKTSKYRSGLEQAFAEATKEEFEYESLKIRYKIQSTYLPDFVHQGSHILVECKGFFRTGDTKKYKAIRDSLPEPWELVFVLSDNRKKLRKGTKMDMGKWCDKEGILWFTMDTLDELLEHIRTKEATG